MSIIIIRTFIIYIAVIFAVRFMGKRQIGQMQPAELVITILISNIATLALESTELPLLNGLVPILFLVSFDVLMSVAMMRSKKFRKLVSGSPQTVISHGQTDNKKLRELRITEEDLKESLREQGIFDINDVDFAVIETNGKLSALEREHLRNAEKGDIQRLADLLKLKGGTL